MLATVDAERFAELLEGFIGKNGNEITHPEDELVALADMAEDAGRPELAAVFRYCRETGRRVAPMDFASKTIVVGLYRFAAKGEWPNCDVANVIDDDLFDLLAGEVIGGGRLGKGLWKTYATPEAAIEDLGRALLERERDER